MCADKQRKEGRHTASQPAGWLASWLRVGRERENWGDSVVRVGYRKKEKGQTQRQPDGWLASWHWEGRERESGAEGEKCGKQKS